MNNYGKTTDITDAVIQVYEALRQQYVARGRFIPEYNPLDREKLDRYFSAIADVEMQMFDLVVRLLDTLVRLQALPNANHRTAMYFTYFLLKFNNIDLVGYPIDTSQWWKVFNEFVRRSRLCLHESEEQYGQSWFDKDCHYRAVASWVTDFTQSAKWSMISSVRTLFRSWTSQAGGLILSGSSGSYIGSDMDLKNINNLGKKINNSESYDSHSYRSREPNISSTRPYSASRSAVERLSHSLNSSSVIGKDMTRENIYSSELSGCTTVSQVQSIRDEMRKKYIAGQITAEGWNEFDKAVQEKLKELM